MRLTINAKNMTVSDSMQERIEKKLNKFDRYFRGEADVQVRLSQERGARNIAEISMNIDGVMLRAQEITNDMYQSVDRAADKIDRQIRRHHTKLDKKADPAALEALAPAEEPAQSWEDEMSDELVRVKRFEVKPMTVEDAIAQMDMLGHSFFVFVNQETGITSVIYRRTDGKVGMLEPILG
ncbi:MAG: ribosome-associated translation inhibitor RaiA [Clostridia bacterium]|nr:ribosome-associated translation inhibitor RaiA [Clostridia bacterium]MBO4886464.1 ribosome-associated translation inhibitor RaiA [Clostridia bacterium]MBR4442819.1 ribosome-associated translation inhibitor RaiA [Clostridia bacterium]